MSYSSEFWTTTPNSLLTVKITNLVPSHRCTCHLKLLYSCHFCHTWTYKYTKIKIFEKNKHVFNLLYHKSTCFSVMEERERGNSSVPDNILTYENYWIKGRNVCHLTRKLLYDKSRLATYFSISYRCFSFFKNTPMFGRELLNLHEKI